jgi:hypothetical protein
MDVAPAGAGIAFCGMKPPPRLYQLSAPIVIGGGTGGD